MTAERNRVPDEEAQASGERSRAYGVIEGLHLRQWLARTAAPVAVLCTNGAGLVDVPALPRHDLGLPPGAVLAARAVGSALIVAAVVLRVRAKGVLVRRTTLTTGGVYRRVRHPFYVGVILGSAGVQLLAGPLGAVAALLWLAASVPVYAVTVAGEEDGLSSLFPAAWQAYAARVPALLPRLFGAGGRAGDAAGESPAAARAHVTWAGLVREHEPPRLLRFLGGALVVAGCGAEGRAAWGLVAAGAALFVLSRALPSLRPRSRRARRGDAG